MKRKIWTGLTILLIFFSLGVVYFYGNTFEEGQIYQQNKLTYRSLQTSDNAEKNLVGEKMSDNLISKDNLVGTWKLVDFHTIDAEKKVAYPFGKNPTGYLIYTEDGYMSASIMTTDRPLLGLSVEEMQDLKNAKLGLALIANLGKYIKASLRYFSAGRNYLSYSGKYEIRDSTVIHHLEVSLVPDWVGLDFERNVEFSEGQIILTNMVRDTSFNLTWKLVN